jgi:hypothetical protein
LCDQVVAVASGLSKISVLELLGFSPRGVPFQLISLLHLRSPGGDEDCVLHAAGQRVQTIG